MKIRRGSIVDVKVTNTFYNITITKILKNRIVGVYKNTICDFLRENIIRIVSY
jgi:hypothetical protein